MSRDLPESDRKLFRELREVALERLCKRVLDEVQPRLADSSRTYYERYIDIFRLLKERDRDVARGFDDPRRSHMIQQLAAIHRLGLLEPEELARFTPRTRDTVEGLAQ
ncbi:MAG TPA: hypothetical protein VF970_10475 [Gemmatimonadales bacterium]